LRSMSQGRAQYSMQFAQYEQVPQQVAEDIKSQVAC
jgi:elongation factor G